MIYLISSVHFHNFSLQQQMNIMIYVVAPHIKLPRPQTKRKLCTESAETQLSILADD
jgi:hypothetical protein